MKTPTIAFAVLFFCSLSFAASPIIGSISTERNSQASLTDGAIISTAATANDVQLDRGVSLHLAPHSSGVIYADHVLLEQGDARLSNFKGYALDAGALRVESEAENTRAIVRMNSQTIEVASLGGALQVIDAGMLTRVESGTKMAFQNSGAATPQPLPHSKTKILVWTMVGIAAAALAIGLTAAAQGKSL